ncbi:MAG: hypothetical protein AAGG51_07445 [Cyanobacteria bacterium P01_G01_bin.54]
MTQFALPRLVVAATIALNVLSLGNLLLSAPVLANETDPFPDSEQDTVFGGQDFDPIDIIHNANLDPGQTPEQFREQTNENLNEARDDFRRQQQERLQELQQQAQELEPESDTTPE